MLSVISSFSTWDWLQVVGTVMVLVGVVGELVVEFKKFPFNPTSFPPIESLKKRIEIISLVVLILGLLLEVLSLPHSLIESAESNRLASQANERASKFEREAGELFKVGEQAKEATTNAEVELEKAKAERETAEAGRLELEKQVLALVEKTKARNISPKARADLAFELNGVPKGNVEIIMSDKDAECMAFGLEIKKSLIAAGFPNVGFSPRDIYRVIELFPEAANSGMDLIFCVKNSSSPPLCSVITLNCLRSNGINASGWPYNDSLYTNDFQIWILPKAVHPDE